MSYEKSDGDLYEYKEYVRGDWLVVEDLTDASYAYAEDLDVYEVRMKGSRLGRFKEWSEVVEYLSSEDL